MNREQRRHGPNGNISLLPQFQAQQPMPAAAPTVLATPFNDVQLVAMMAASMLGTPEDVVDRATEIVAQAVIKQGNLPKRLKELAEKMKAEIVQ